MPNPPNSFGLQTSFHATKWLRPHSSLPSHKKFLMRLSMSFVTPLDSQNKDKKYVGEKERTN